MKGYVIRRIHCDRENSVIFILAFVPNLSSIFNQVIFCGRQRSGYSVLVQYFLFLFLICFVFHWRIKDWDFRSNSCSFRSSKSQLKFPYFHLKPKQHHTNTFTFFSFLLVIISPLQTKVTKISQMVNILVVSASCKVERNV